MYSQYWPDITGIEKNLSFFKNLNLLVFMEILLSFIEVFWSFFDKINSLIFFSKKQYLRCVYH